MSQSIEKKLFPFSKELRSSDSEVDILVEEEPVVIYEVKWRTVLAVFALSLSNVCAALSNTVSSTPLDYNSAGPNFLDKHNDSLSNRCSRKCQPCSLDWQCKLHCNFGIRPRSRLHQ